MKNRQYIASALLISELIATKQIQTSNALDFIHDLITQLKNVSKQSDNENELVNLVSILKNIAKGEDGIFGTTDDLIPKSTIDDLQKMVNTTIFDDIVHVIYDGFHNKKMNTKKCFYTCLKLF